MKNDNGIDPTGEVSDRQKDQPVDRTSDRRRVLQGVGGVGAFVTILASRPAFAQELSPSCATSIMNGASAPTCADKAESTQTSSTNHGNAYGLNGESQGKKLGHENAPGQDQDHTTW
jgi:hypothetical protein